MWGSEKATGWDARCRRQAAETLLLHLARIQAFFPDSLLCSTGLGAAGRLGGLSRASSGAGPGGGRVWSQEAVGTMGSSHRAAGRAWLRPVGKPGLSVGETGRLAEGWVRFAESQTQGAQGDCTCHGRSGRAAPGQEGPDRVRQGGQRRMLRGQRCSELGCRGLPCSRYAWGRGREAPGLGCAAGRNALGLGCDQTGRPGDHRSLVPCSSRVSSALGLAMAAAAAAAAAEEPPPPPGSRGTC